MGFFKSVVVTTAPRAAILVRLLVGAMFLSEGIQKFFSQTLGVGHFAKIGILCPEITAPFVGGIEIVGGILTVSGMQC